MSEVRPTSVQLKRKALNIVGNTALNFGKGIMTTVPAWCVSVHASFFFKIDSQKTQSLIIALNKMQLLKKIRLYVEVIFMMPEMGMDASMDA